LRETLIRFFEGDMSEEELFVPYGLRGAIGEIRSRVRVVDESYESEGVQLRLRGTAASFARLRAKYDL